MPILGGISLVARIPGPFQIFGGATHEKEESLDPSLLAGSGVRSRRRIRSRTGSGCGSAGQADELVRSSHVARQEAPGRR